MAIELDVKPEPNGDEHNFSLWLNGREVGGLQLFDHDLGDEVFSNSVVIIRRGNMSSDLRDKHLDYQKRISDAKL